MAACLLVDLLQVPPGGAGKRAHAAVSITPLRVEAWMEGLLLRLALAGPAGYLKNALLRRRLGCCAADCA